LDQQVQENPASRNHYGFNKPDKGTILIGNKDVTDVALKKEASAMSRRPQRFFPT